MNYLNLILDCLAVMYLNHKIEAEGASENYTHKLVSDSLAIIPVSQLSGEMDYDSQSIENIRVIVNDMLINQSSSYYNYDFLILKLKQGNKNNPTVAEYMIDIETQASVSGTLESIKIILGGLINGINKICNNVEIKRRIQRFAFDNIKNNDPNFDWEPIIRKFGEEITPYYTSNRTSILDDKNIISSKVDFSSDDSIKEMLLKSADSYDPEMSLKLPFKLLNKMCGAYDGLPRPIFASISTLTHSYKTGMMIDWFIGIPMFNKPKLLDPTKKPLLLFISLENEIEVNLATCYKLIREWEFGEEIDINRLIRELKTNSTKLADVSRYIQDNLGKNGWHTQMIRCKPSEMDYMKLFSLLDYYQMMGYEIIGLLIDYLLMMSKRGCDQPSGTGSDSRDLVRRVRNYTTPNKIATASPFQLSTTAKELKRTILASDSANPLEFLRELRRGNMYDGCRSLEQEMDLELFMDIIHVNNVKCLAIGRGKHRGVLQETPDEHKECILPFQKVGRLVPDVNKPDDVVLGWNKLSDAKNATMSAIYTKNNNEGGVVNGWGG